MGDAPSDLDAVRRHEVHILFVAGASYVAVASLIEVVTLDSPLSVVELVVAGLLSLALAARYLFWSRLSIDAPARRDLPYLLSGAVLVLTIGVLLRSEATLFFYLMAAEGCASFFRRRWRATWVIAVIALSAALYFSFRSWPAAGLAFVESVPVYLLLAVAADLMVRQHDQRAQVERLLTALSEAHRQLADYTAQAEALAVAHERTRLAREIHDTLGHALTALDVQLELLVRLPESQVQARREAGERSLSLVRNGLAELRRAVQALRPGALEVFSLPEAIAELVASFRETTKIEVIWRCEGEIAPLPPALGVPLYRAAQETLTNVRRHAAAAQVRMTLRFVAESVTLSVEDDGRGGDPQFGFGLRGLQERTEALGGEFHAGPGPERGFLVEMKLPR